MGDPRKPKKQFRTPSHPWQKERIDLENDLVKEYGLKTKTEVWKATSIVGDFKNSAKRLVALSSTQADLEREQLLERVARLGLINKGDPLDKILGLSIRDVLERRLQSVLFRKSLANSMKQARQFVTHGQVMINNKKITAPSYLVLKAEETGVNFLISSSLADPEHPERNNSIKEEMKKAGLKSNSDKKESSKKPTKKTEVSKEEKVKVPKKEEVKEEKSEEKKK